MFFFDNFIITQRTFYMISGFIILFLGTIINFAISGLLNKNSQKFSNFITIATLLISSISFLPFLYGFLSPHSSKAFYFFNQNIAFGGLEALLCFIAQITVLFAFLISKTHLSKLRFKQYYFNSLYLCSALSTNMLIVSKGFIPFILSLETLSICTLFMLLGFKNRNVFYNAYKYLTISSLATLLMIFSYAISSGFNVNTGVLAVSAKILFTMALLIKGGFTQVFAWNIQDKNKKNYPSFIFINTVVFFTYAIALHKMVHNIFETGSLAQIFFTLFFLISCTISAFKITRVENFKDFVYTLNTLNYCILGFLFFIQNTQIHTVAIILLFNILIVNFGLLSSGAILNINKNSNLDFKDFYGISYSNPAYCKLLSVIIFISVAVVPSGIFSAKFLTNIALAQTGLWSSIVMVLFAVTYTLTIASATNFITSFYKKPNTLNDLSIFKKRTNLSYSILFISIIISLRLFVFNGYITNVITSFLL